MSSVADFGMNRNKSDWFRMNFNPKLLPEIKLVLVTVSTWMGDRLRTYRWHFFFISFPKKYQTIYYFSTCMSTISFCAFLHVLKTKKQSRVVDFFSYILGNKMIQLQ